MTTKDMLPGFLAQIDSDAYCSVDAIYGQLKRLLAAPAPNSGAGLPGAVGDVIRELAADLGLRLSDDPRIQATGNLAIEIGAKTEVPDLIITAHMDRPTCRVLNLDEATLYPLCAIRVPRDNYVCDAIAVGYRDGGVRPAARGQLHFRESADDYVIRFEAASGALSWGDSVLMAAEPKLREGRIIGTGLDNAAGVLIGLLSARALSSLSVSLAERGRKIIFAFTDQEEGPPIGLFGQGAARLLGALGPPRLGFINIDGHNVDEALGQAPGIGASHAFVSGYGRGSVVPLEYQALAAQLADRVNQHNPGAVRLNYSYVSRSDDMLLSTRSRCLGLIGVTLANAHTAEETVSLEDVAAAVRWVGAFVSSVIDFTAEYPKSVIDLRMS